MKKFEAIEAVKEKWGTSVKKVQTEIKRIRSLPRKMAGEAVMWALKQIGLSQIGID